MRLSPSERAVLIPLVFFSLFDRPVRRTALRHLAYRSHLTGRQVETVIDALEARNVIVTRHGYVALFECGHKVPAAQARDRLSDELWHEARQLIASLGHVPFIKLVAVVNSLAFHNAHAGSDIDLLVVTESGHLAAARDAFNAMLTLWRRRNTKGNKRGKLSVDVWMDTSNLSLAGFTTQSRDLYFEYWTAWMAPIINRDGTYQKLIAANPWVIEALPQFEYHDRHMIALDPRTEQHRQSWEAFYRSSLGRWLETLQTRWQQERLARFEARVKGKGTVLITPHRLRFHIPDRRAEYQAAFEEKWRHLTASPL